MDLYEKINRNPHNVTPKQLIELLKSCGFELRNTVGDHVLYKRSGYRPIPVPIRQNPLAIHIVKEALKIIREIRELEQD
jgi:predicted RNA binding protein YcfA (HicA-like mRNA interferase family)